MRQTGKLCRLTKRYRANCSRRRAGAAGIVREEELNATDRAERAGSETASELCNDRAAKRGFLVTVAVVVMMVVAVVIVGRCEVVAHEVGNDPTKLAVHAGPLQHQSHRDGFAAMLIINDDVLLLEAKLSQGTDTGS